MGTIVCLWWAGIVLDAPNWYFVILVCKVGFLLIEIGIRMAIRK